MKFSELNLSAQLNAAIEKLNYKECTPIQEQAIPHILEGKDLAGLAQTGTGKTAAFLLPLIERVLRASALKTKTDATAVSPEEEVLNKRAFADWLPFQYILVLVPTRELAEQVYENFNALAENTGLKACSIYGGTSYDKQKEGLKNGVTLVVATPGRLIDLYKEHLVDLKQVRAVVFDEADRMFDMGFKDDMKYLLQRIPNDRQFLVFSATLNFDVLNTAYQFGANPIEINISRDQAKAENVEDSIFHLGSEDKPKYLLSLLKLHQPKQSIIFSNFKNQIEDLVRFLRNNNVPALGISSLLTQAQRNKVLSQFKEEGSSHVLVATDVAARGLDIQGIDMVINYELPQDCETYVHRIGRTGRAGQTGKAFSFVGDRDVDSLMRIEEYLKHKLSVGWLEDQNIVTEFTPFQDGYRHRDDSRRSDHRRSEGRFSRDKRGGDSSRPRRRERGEEHRGSAHHPAGASANGGGEGASAHATPGAHAGSHHHKKRDGHHSRDRDRHHKPHDKAHDKEHSRSASTSSAHKTAKPHHDRHSKHERHDRHDRHERHHDRHDRHDKHKHHKRGAHSPHLPVRPGVYKINLWYKISKFFKNIFD